MTDADVEAFLDLEIQVWEALVRGDAAADAQLLASDFLGVYPTGFADRTAHAGQLEQGPTVAEYAVHDARMLVLSPDSVLLAYRADWRRRSASGIGDTETMFVSSVWSRREDGWVNVFSQDTPASEDASAPR